MTGARKANNVISASAAGARALIWSSDTAHTVATRRRSVSADACPDGSRAFSPNRSRARPRSRSRYSPSPIRVCSTYPAVSASASGRSPTSSASSSSRAVSVDPVRSLQVAHRLRAVEDVEGHRGRPPRSTPTTET
jgi:hypothetical protein